MFVDMTQPTPEQEAGLSNADRQRIEAEEAYRAQVRAGYGAPPPAPQKKGGCFRAGCGGAVALFLIAGLAAQCSGGPSTPSATTTTSTPSSSAPARHFIKSDGYLGCSDREVFDRLVGFAVDGDNEAFNALMRSSDCVPLRKGEEVFLEDVPLLSGAIKVRRKGEVAGYWTNVEAVD